MITFVMDDRDILRVRLMNRRFDELSKLQLILLR